MPRTHAYSTTSYISLLVYLNLQELDRNVALRVTETDSSDIYEVSGRGQLHLTVLIETMRREGFELLVGPPTVITRKENGKVRYYTTC
jgi:predicted membrane GTPase involved in stress response